MAARTLPSRAERNDVVDLALVGVAALGAVVALATAHAAKFPDAVVAATGGLRPALPPHLADLMDRPERFARVANDQAAIEAFIRERSRITKAA